MSGAHWAVLGLLALSTFAIRFAGLIAGDRIRTSRHAWVLEDLPGLLVISLVVSSVAGQPLPYWIAAGLALGIAAPTNNLIATMAGGAAGLYRSDVAWRLKPTVIPAAARGAFSQSRFTDAAAIPCRSPLFCPAQPVSGRPKCCGLHEWLLRRSCVAASAFAAKVGSGPLASVRLYLCGFAIEFTENDVDPVPVSVSAPVIFDRCLPLLAVRDAIAPSAHLSIATP